MLVAMLGLVFLFENAGDFSSGAKQEQANASCSKACHLGDFAVGVVFCVGQPEQLAVVGTHTGQRGLEESCGVHLLR